MVEFNLNYFSLEQCCLNIYRCGIVSGEDDSVFDRGGIPHSDLFPAEENSSLAALPALPPPPGLPPSLDFEVVASPALPPPPGFLPSLDFEVGSLAPPNPAKAVPHLGNTKTSWFLRQNLNDTIVFPSERYFIKQSLLIGLGGLKRPLEQITIIKTLTRDRALNAEMLRKTSFFSFIGSFNQIFIDAFYQYVHSQVNRKDVVIFGLCGLTVDKKNFCEMVGHSGNGIGLPCIIEPTSMKLHPSDWQKLRSKWPHWIMKPIAFSDKTAKTNPSGGMGIKFVTFDEMRIQSFDNKYEYVAMPFLHQPLIHLDSFGGRTRHLLINIRVYGVVASVHPDLLVYLSNHGQMKTGSPHYNFSVSAAKTDKYVFVTNTAGSPPSRKQVFEFKQRGSFWPISWCMNSSSKWPTDSTWPFVPVIEDSSTERKYASVGTLRKLARVSEAAGVPQSKLWRNIDSAIRSFWVEKLKRVRAQSSKKDCKGWQHWEHHHVIPFDSDIGLGSDGAAFIFEVHPHIASKPRGHYVADVIDKEVFRGAWGSVALPIMARRLEIHKNFSEDFTAEELILCKHEIAGRALGLRLIAGQRSDRVKRCADEAKEDEWFTDAPEDSPQNRGTNSAEGRHRKENMTSGIRAKDSNGTEYF